MRTGNPNGCCRLTGLHLNPACDTHMNMHYPITQQPSKSTIDDITTRATYT
jgi:hypothetical protein